MLDFQLQQQHHQQQNVVQLKIANDSMVVSECASMHCVYVCVCTRVHMCAHVCECECECECVCKPILQYVKPKCNAMVTSPIYAIAELLNNMPRPYLSLNYVGDCVKNLNFKTYGKP